MFNVRVCFSSTPVTLNANNYLLGCVLFGFSVIYEFLLSNACSHGDLLPKEEKESRRKKRGKKGSGSWSQILPAESLCVLLSHQLAAVSLVLVVFLDQNSPVWA